MSRLDDELRVAFRRQEPPPDFASRVLERIAAAPAPKPTLWQRLRALFEGPTVRWVAVGAAASLLVALGAIQYREMRKPASDAPPALANQTPAPERVVTPAPAGKDAVAPAVVAADNPVRHRPKPRAVERRITRDQYLKSEQARAEGLAAKQQLMMALHIASNTLKEAQKVVQEGGRDLRLDSPDNP
jgi:hypothetical protein